MVRSKSEVTARNVGVNNPHRKSRIYVYGYKSTAGRRPSVRELENFDCVRQQFETLAMSLNEGHNSKKGPERVPISQEVLGEQADLSRNSYKKTADDLRKSAEELLVAREKPLRILRAFGNTAMVSRQMLAGVGNKVTLRNKIKTLDTQLDFQYSEWLDCCELTVEELEEKNDPLRQSNISAKFEESGIILDKVDEAFKNTKIKYPDKQEVIDYLDFVDKPLKSRSRDISPGSDKSPSASSGKGEEYILGKLPKLQKEIETKFNAVKNKFEVDVDCTEHSLNQALKSLESLLSKLDDGSSFEKLLKEAYEFPDFDKETITKYEEWQDIQKGLIESLTVTVNESIEKKIKEKADAISSTRLKS